MHTPASIFERPVHPMLFAFPIGTWIFSLACGLTFPAGASGEAWITVAFTAWRAAASVRSAPRWQERSI
jgi:uncharacterized membrane protein